jgi:hypothetical protein
MTLKIKPIARVVFFCGALLLAGGVHGDTHVASNSDLTGIAWTAVTHWTPNSPPNKGGQATVRVVYLARGGDLIIFDGFVNSTLNGGPPYVISDGDPISGYAGRWLECGDTIRIAYIKHYFWPSELKDSTEKAFSQIHADSITPGHGKLRLGGQTFSHVRAPTIANLEAEVPSPEKLWRDRQDLRKKIDTQLVCGG